MWLILPIKLMKVKDGANNSFIFLVYQKSF